MFFDAGLTLIHPDPPVGVVYADALRRAGVPAEPEQAEREFQTAWLQLREDQPAADLEYGSTADHAMDWWRLVVRRSFARFGEPTDFEGIFRSLWDHFAAGSAWRIYGDVEPVFRALRSRGIGIGLISNWDVRLRRLLDELELTRQLDWVVISCEMGVEKPHPAIFEQALSLCGHRPGSVMHVGDSLREDVQGALDAGLRAAWLRRNDSGNDPPPGASVVRELTAIPSLLA